MSHTCDTCEHGATRNPDIFDDDDDSDMSLEANVDSSSGDVNDDVSSDEQQENYQDKRRVEPVRVQVVTPSSSSGTTSNSAYVTSTADNTTLTTKTETGSQASLPEESIVNLTMSTLRLQKESPGSHEPLSWRNSGVHARFSEHRRPSSSTSEESQHIHIESPGHTVTLDKADLGIKPMTSTTHPFR
ncbi:hypothetical protein Bbelb_111350 [Branchiostoma belcheri]|nr:hypothetical protein Bbelb_111350 [Branchiostoma belcheri]